MPAFRQKYLPPSSLHWKNERVKEIGDKRKTDTEHFVHAFEVDFHEDARFAAAFAMDSPGQANVGDPKRFWGWTAAAGTAVSAIAFTAAAFGAANSWNPVG